MGSVPEPINPLHLAARMRQVPFWQKAFPHFFAFCNRPLGVRVFVTLWVVIGLALAVKSLVKPGSHSVFPVYYNASWNWWLEETLYLRHPQLDYFRYPPVAALFFFPFALFGPTMGPILWGWFSLGLFAWSCQRLCDAFLVPGRRDEKRFGLMVFGLLAMLGALAGIWNYQSNALIGALLILGMLDVKERRWNRAACYFTGAILLKPTVLPPLVLLSVIHPWQMGWRLPLGVLLGFLAPLLTKPPEIVLWQYQEWLEHLRDTHGERWPGFRDAWFAWLAFREQWLGGPLWPFFWDVIPNLVYRVSQIAAGLVCFAAVLLWYRRGLNRDQFLLRSLTLGLLWLMLFGPATEFPTFGLISPLLAWGTLAAWDKGESSRPSGGARRTDRWLTASSLVLILVLGWRPTVVWIAPHLPIVLLAIPLGVVLFAIWLFADTDRLIRSARSAAVSPDDSAALQTRPVALDSTRAAGAVAGPAAA